MCAALSETFENGITTLSARGYYSNSERTLIYFVVNHLQIGRMKNIVHAIDPKAYIVINDVADIFPSTNIVEEVEVVENDEK